MLIFAEKYDRNKEEKRKMKRIISILLYMAVLLPLAAQPPKHEVRAAWITAVYGLDWPQTRTTSPEGIRKQQAELIEILDRLKAANFNTVLFQTRTRGDVLYKSAIEPYNSILTGKVGGDPGSVTFDPPSSRESSSSSLQDAKEAPKASMQSIPNNKLLTFIITVVIVYN